MTSPAPAADESPPVIGIVCALAIESGPFQNRCRRMQVDKGNGLIYRGLMLGDQRICLVECGAGRKRAAHAAHALIDGLKPSWILSVGFSGALSDGLKLGDIVLGNGIMDDEGRNLVRIDVTAESSPESGLHVGRLCMADRIVRTIAEKRALAEKTGALAVDMESLAVAEACARRSTRFMAIRVISDDMQSDLPPEVLAILSPQGAVRAGAVVGALWKRPGSYKDLWALRERAVSAAERLAGFLEAAIPRLK